MKFRQLVILVSAIAIGFLVSLLFKPSTAAISQWISPQSGLEPTYKISDDIGVVVESADHNLLIGYFVVRGGENWIRFDVENTHRTMPAIP